MRMRGRLPMSIAQTYYLLDHPKMSTSRDIFYSLDEELQEEQDQYNIRQFKLI